MQTVKTKLKHFTWIQTWTLPTNFFRRNLPKGKFVKDEILNSNPILNQSWTRREQNGANLSCNFIKKILSSFSRKSNVQATQIPHIQTMQALVGQLFCGIAGLAFCKGPQSEFSHNRFV